MDGFYATLFKIAKWRFKKNDIEHFKISNLYKDW